MTASPGALASALTTDVSGPVDLIASYCAADVALPAPVVAAATRGVVDMLGVAVAGSVLPAMRPLTGYVAQTFANGRATAYGLAGGTVAEGAAWVNGAAAHLLDFDDCLDIMGGHPTVPVLPAVLALAEADGTSVENALASYAIGVQAETALGRCLNFRHYERGWHPTATLGIFGATAASARLLALDARTTATALLIASSFASGIKGNFGSPMKPVQVGYAASKGIAAARLAAAGITANYQAFEGPQSFGTAFNALPYAELDWEPLTRLHEGWEIVSPGLTFKLYPCCGSTHAPIAASIEVAKRSRAKPDDIERIEVGVHPRRRPHTDRADPRTGPEGRFSLQYVVAVGLARGAVGLEDFTDESIDNPVVRGLMSRLTIYDLPPEEQSLVPGRADCYAGTVRVVLRDGSEIRFHAATPRGFDPAAPVSDSDLQEKFIRTAATAVGDETAVRLLALVLAWWGEPKALGEFHSILRSALPGRLNGP